VFFFHKFIKGTQYMYRCSENARSQEHQHNIMNMSTVVASRVLARRDVPLCLVAQLLQFIT